MSFIKYIAWFLTFKILLLKCTKTSFLFEMFSETGSKSWKRMIFHVRTMIVIKVVRKGYFMFVRWLWSKLWEKWQKIDSNSRLSESRCSREESRLKHRIGIAGNQNFSEFKTTEKLYFCFEFYFSLEKTNN